MFPFFLLTYSILGGGIKYIDDAFDAKVFSKNMAYILAPLLALLGVYCMMIDPVSATILLAIIVGVFIKGKVDNLAFIGAFAFVLLMIILLGIDFLIIPLVLLSSAAVLDEIGNDFIDSRKKDMDQDKFTSKFLNYFFGHRWILKISILFLVMIGLVPFYFFFAMLFFDYSYVLIGMLGRLKRGETELPAMGSVVAKIACIFK